MCESSSFVPFIQDCFGYLGSLRFHKNFRMGFSVSAKKKKKKTHPKKCHWDFDKDYIESVDHFGEYCYLKILSSNL